MNTDWVKDYEEIDDEAIEIMREAEEREAEEDYVQYLQDKCATLSDVIRIIKTKKVDTIAIYDSNNCEVYNNLHMLGKDSDLTEDEYKLLKEVLE